MSSRSSSNPKDPNRQWFITQRWQQFEGEQRANLLRILSVGAFYVVHLLNYHRVSIGFLQLGSEPVETAFHASATKIAVIWSMLALAIHLCLTQKFFPSWLGYAATVVDVVLLTSLLCLGGGQTSPLVLGYLLILIVAALRLSLPLIRFATLACLFGYLMLLACTKWPHWFGLEQLERVPRYAQIMTLLAIALGGIMLGQILRRVRRMAEDFATRMGIEREPRS